MLKLLNNIIYLMFLNNLLTSKSKTVNFKRVLLESIKITCSLDFFFDKNLTHSKKFEIAGVNNNITLINLLSSNS